MPQPPAYNWKRAAFRTVARLERALRGSACPSPQGLRGVRNFLLLQYETPLGSAVHAAPLLEALKTAMPDAYIAVAASRMAASVLGNSPFLDRCVVTPNPFTNFSRAVAAVRRLLHTMPPGTRCILTTIGNRRPRVALLAAWVGEALRVGHTATPELYDMPLLFVPEKGQIEGNLDILRALGHAVEFREPRIYFSQEDADFSFQLLKPIGQRPDAVRIALVTQNSGGQRNRWKAERFQQTIANLVQSCGAVPVFLGTAADASAIESLRNSLPNAGISLAGKTTVPQLAAVLAQCDLIVSLDTGTFHVARAVGLPGVVIAPAWQDPREWLPVNHPSYRVLRGPSVPVPPSGYMLEEISVDQVLAAAIECMEKFPASLDARMSRLLRGIVTSAPA